jgi:16S rRNA (uracil1498-N3)-methyltransferase
MHRFYLPPKDCQEAVLALTGREAHHASHVLRVRAGEQVTVLDGIGHELLCKVEAVERNEVRLVLMKKQFVPPLPYRITLVQALPKGKIIEAIIQKASELGVFRIVPLLAERVVSHVAGEAGASKTEKWRQVAIEAIKQCGSPWLPQIEPPVTPVEFLARKENFDLPLVASLQPDRKYLREYLRAFQTGHKREPQSVCIWVGPEGDFTPDEMNIIKASGALPITLGPGVLRTETAAIYCLSVLNYELQPPE